MAIDNSYLREAVRRAGSGESEAEVRARRVKLVADLRAEGASDATVARLTGDDAVRRLIRHETQTIAAITGLFASIGGRTA